MSLAISPTTAPRSLLRRLPKPAREPEPPHGQVAEDEGVRLDRAGLTAHAAVADQGRALAQAVRQAAGRGPADRIDAEADLRAAGRLGNPFRQVLAVDEDDVAARLAHDRDRVLPPHHVHGPVAAVPGQLHQVQAHGRVGRVLDYPLVRLQRHEFAQQQRRRRRVDRHHRQLQWVCLVRQLHELLCLGDDVRGPAAAADRQQHQLADREALGVRAELGNPPDSLPAPDRRQRWQLSVFAGQRQQIRGVDRRRGHLDQRLAGLEPRRVELDRVNHVLRHRTALLVLGSEHGRTG